MADVKINYAHMQKISDSYNGKLDKGAISYIDELEEICDHIEEEIDDMSGLFVGMAENNLQDIRDSIRGLRTSYDGIGSAIDKYLNRMQDKLEAKSEDRMIFVNGEIESYKSQMKQAQDDCKDGIKSDVWNIHTIVLKPENQNLKELANMSIDNYNEYASNCRRMIDNKFDLVIDEVKKLEDWNESDYNEAFHVVKAVGMFAAEVAICTTGVGAIVLGGAMAAKASYKMYRHGSSAAVALTGGAAVAGVNFIAGKAGEAVGSKAVKIIEHVPESKMGMILKDTAKDVLPTEKMNEWTTKFLENKVSAEVIENKLSDSNVGRYLKSSEFNDFQNSIKNEVNKQLENGLEIKDDLLEHVEFITDPIEKLQEKNKKLSDKLGSYFESNNMSKIANKFENHTYSEVAIDKLEEKGIDFVIEEINQNYDIFKNDIANSIEHSFVQGMIGNGA